MPKDLVFIASSILSPMEGNADIISFDINHSPLLCCSNRKVAANADIHEPVSQERRDQVRCRPKSLLDADKSLTEDFSSILSKGGACNGWNKSDHVLVDDTQAATTTVGVCGRRIQKRLHGMTTSSTSGHIKRTQKRKSGVAFCFTKRRPQLWAAMPLS